ncbi:hypothetical protein BS78_09G156600 [Paspalum vaginatum]|nr:hypothetical protein BS78_09G156600 [Paspalum vaginatum]
MDKILIIVSAVIGSLGVLSAILGFSAEGTKLTPYDILVYGDECIYPQNPALGLGICAFVFLLAAQVTFSAVGGCCGCCKSRSIPSETKRIVGIVCAVASWIAAVIAWVLLIEGAAWNANVVRTTAPNCYYLKDGIFAGAGVLSLAATALGIASYIMMRTQRPNKAATAAAAPAVPAKTGEPQFPPAAQGNNNNGSTASNQEPAPPTVASAPPEPVKLPSAIDQPPQDPLPQVPVPIPVPATATQVGLEIPVVPSPPPPHPPATGNGSSALSTVIRNEVARQGIKLAARVVEQSFLSDNIAAPTTMPGVGDILVSMMTDSSTGDLQSADYVDAA